MSWGQTCPSTLGLDLSRGRTNPKTSGPEVSKSSRVGSISRPEMSKSLGPEMSRGRTWFAAGCVLELLKFSESQIKKYSKTDF